MWGPGLVPGGKVVAETVQTIDMMPTVLSLVGLQAPEGVFGASLTPLLFDGEDPWVSRPAITERSLRPIAKMEEREDQMEAFSELFDRDAT